MTGYDPDGHFLHIVAGAAIGALVSGGLSYASQAIKNKSFTKGINWQKVAGSAAEGAIIGGVGAATGGAGLAASAAGTAAKTGAKTVAKTTAKAVAKKVAINVAGNAAGNVANQAISKGVKKISAKEAAVAGATGILDVAGNAAGTALKKAGSKAVRKIAGAAAEGAGAIAAKKAGAKAAQKALGTSAEAGLAGAGKNAVSSQQGLGKKLLDGIDNLKSTGKALLKDEGGFLDLDALAGKKSVSGAVGKSGSKSGSGSKFQEVFDLADNYTLSDDTFDNHILDRHGPNSTYGNKSHFNADFDIRNSIDSTLTGDNFIVGPNTAGREGYIFEQIFSNPIGTNSKGKPLYTLKVVIDEAGNVITAFPKK